MLAEIREQPSALRRLLEQKSELRAAGDALIARRPRAVRLVGHGTSDNAATYGVYALGLLSGWTAFRDSMSLTVYYDAPLDFAEAAVVAISQSGETPDVVEYVSRARSKGALTVALTNDDSSSLAHTSEHVVPLCAGPEHGVAATKTYVNSLAALALLAAHAGGIDIAQAIHATAHVIEETVADVERSARRVAADFAYIGRLFVLGRGLELATAREIALKLQETCRVAADALTATDFAHGPVNAVDPLFPVWMIATRDANLPTVVEAARRARAAGATVVATGAAASDIDDSAYRLPTPAAPMPVLSPLVSVVPGQLFARALALTKGYDPDQPTHLTKVTRVP
jgi:glucosamine--fructose-6-phosphate aminotransferase (isomerizing)